jgi:hypothetical protein
MGWIKGQQVGREKRTIYTDEKGNRIELDGDRPWRNNNPQDLRYSTDSRAKADGAIGRDSNGFGIFPDYDTGLQAMKDWWRRKTDAGKTIEEAVKIAAPPSENDVEKYCQTLEKETGLSRKTKLDTLTDNDWSHLYRGVQAYEGYYRGARDGKIIELPPIEVSGRGIISFLGEILSSVIGPSDAYAQAQSIPFSPLVLDLNGDGVKTTALTDGAYFDHDKNGFAEQTGWASPEDGILVLDRNNDGIINDGGELFGNGTVLQNGQNAHDGFQALAELDNNHDGKIDVNDTAFNQLKIWQDIDGDGYSSSDELHTLDESGIQSINTSSTNSTYIDPQGNEHRLIGSFTKSDGSTSDMADVWFITDKTYTIANDWLDVPDNIATFHNICLYDHRAHTPMKRKNKPAHLVFKPQGKLPASLTAKPDLFNEVSVVPRKER